MPTHAELKQRQRTERDAYAEHISLRIHRSLSWLERAEACEGDLDAEFIFLWISFNAAYSNLADPAHRKFEKETYGMFLKHVCELDDDQSIYQTVWQEFPKSIRVLLDNQYVFQPFWDFHNGFISEEEWQSKFQQAKNNAHFALGKKLTAQVIDVIFDRLYTLRNQILHGGATWNSAINRNQMRDATAILRKLVPLIIQVLLNHPNRFIGEAVYPIVND